MPTILWYLIQSGVGLLGDEVAWLSVWGKSVRDDREVCTGWLPLFQHLDDAMGVAGCLVDEWVSPLVLRRIARDIGGDFADVRALACWLAGVHDVGKASPAFAVKNVMLADRMRRWGLSAKPQIVVDLNWRAVSHAIVGHLATREWLRRHFGFEFRGMAGQLGSIVGSHHGVPPESTQLALALDNPELMGVGVWAETRELLLTRAVARVGGPDVLSTFGGARLSVPSQALLTAIVIVADWIASNDELFPLWPASTLNEPLVPPDDELSERRLAGAWKSLNFPPRWTAQSLAVRGDELFRERFGRSAGALRPVQRAALDAAGAQAHAEMLVIEAPMGSGKTEAALLAAEVVAQRSGASGVFVALPTQATTDAMFSRVRAWLDHLPGRVEGAGVSVRLAHGKAHLNDEFTGLVRRGRYVQVGDGDTVVVHDWFAGRKRAALASFVVGTIDQVLFAGLKSRHLMLRHLALAGKVVIIDEVHAYDVYMSQYLHRVLHWLAAYGVPVVLLSATLPPSRRTELLRAYESGRGDASNLDSNRGYPLISGTGGLAPVELPMPRTRTSVQVDKLDDGLDTLARYLSTHLADGGCAVVVRNTVTRVQETAEYLAAVFGADAVTINHSRFLACDRAGNDRGLLRRFGPPDHEPDRPVRHIVVASQVVEQSLDVDFDLMVTDLAPVDLLLQRMGRLHRHDRERPSLVARPRCAVVGVTDAPASGVGGWDATPVTAVRGSRRVYGEHLLFRAAGVLLDRDEVVLPHDIAPLVHLAYSDTPVGPVDWQPAMAEAARAAEVSAHRRREAAKAFLLGEAHGTGDLTGWLRAGVGDARDDARGLAQVRDGEENVEVLVVQRDIDGGLLVPDWIEGGGTQIPLDQQVPSRLARTIAACSVRLPLALSHPGVIDLVIRELETNHVSSFDNSPLLAGQLVLVLDRQRRADLHQFRLTYDSRRGLLHERRTV